MQETDAGRIEDFDMVRIASMNCFFGQCACFFASAIKIPNPNYVCVNRQTDAGRIEDFVKGKRGRIHRADCSPRRERERERI
jgi:hypothetical protein